jgi:hypothetical protein
MGKREGMDTQERKSIEKSNRSMRTAERMLRHPIWQVTWRKTCQQETSILYNALANIEI